MGFRCLAPTIASGTRGILGSPLGWCTLRRPLTADPPTLIPLLDDSGHRRVPTELPPRDDVETFSGFDVGLGTTNPVSPLLPALRRPRGVPLLNPVGPDGLGDGHYEVRHGRCIIHLMYPTLVAVTSITVGQSYYVSYAYSPPLDPLSEPCKACSCSGWYVDYGGFSVGGVLVPCKECNGCGYITDQKKQTTSVPDYSARVSWLR